MQSSLRPEGAMSGETFGGRSTQVGPSPVFSSIGRSLCSAASFGATRSYGRKSPELAGITCSYRRVCASNTRLTHIRGSSFFGASTSPSLKKPFLEMPFQLPRQPSNQSMERTAARRALRFFVATNRSLRSVRALSGGRSSLSR